MEAIEPHHLPIGPEHVVGNGGHGRVFFLPGSDGRARRISQHFVDRRGIEHERQHNVFLGRLEKEGISVDVATVSTGMGCTSLNVIVTELIALGARQLLRVGTSGSVVPAIVRAGDLVIATAGVRDEGVSDRYIGREYPAVGHFDWIFALHRAALELGYGDRTYMGVVHAKDALYAMEFGEGPLGRENHEYMVRLQKMRVLASDMETSHLFVLSDAHSTQIVPITQSPSPADVVRAGSILAVVGDDTPYASADRIREAEARVIEVAIEAAFELFRVDTALHASGGVDHER